jgi:peptidyl-prolyl cis-trans isomerase D
MAVIGTIRKQSGLLVIIIGVALAAFILGDFLKRRPQGRDMNIAVIDGEEIPYTYFNQKVEKNIENTKTQQKKQNLTPDEVFRIRQQTYDQIVDEIILKKEYDELGLVVSPEELFDQLQGDNPHKYILQYFKDPKTNQYDPELVRNYIKQLDKMDATNRARWEEFVKAIKEDRLQTKYKDLISKAYFMPDTFLVKDYIDRKTTAKVRLVGARYSTIADSTVTVADADMEKYYEEYKQNYEQPESRDIDYVIFDVKPSSKDRQKIRKMVFEIFEDFKKADNAPLFVARESDERYDSTYYKEGQLPVRIDSVMFNSPVGTFVEPYVENNAWHMAKLEKIVFRPDSMKASHILIAYAGARNAGQDVTRIRIDAKAIADSLLNVVKANPEKLEEIAKQMSDDPSAKQNSGDLGWFADGQMVPQFNEAVFNTPVGGVTMVESDFGFHIIKVTGKLKPRKRVRVAQITINITPSQQTYQDVYTKASEFQGKAVNLEAFDTLATSMGLNKRTAQRLQPMSDRIAGLDNPRSIIQWLYTDGIDVGSVSQVYTLTDMYVVAAVTKVRQAGIPPLDEIRDMLEPLVKKELKGDMMVKKMTDIAKNSKNLSQIASKLNSKVDTVPNLTFMTRNIAGFGNEANVLGKAFTLKTKVISKPVKGNNAGFFVVVDELKKADLKGNTKLYEKQLLMNFVSKVNNNSYIKTLKDNTDITDNRVRFY